MIRYERKLRNNYSEPHSRREGLFYMVNVHTRGKMCIESVQSRFYMSNQTVQVMHNECIVLKRYCAHIVKLLFCVWNQENGETPAGTLKTE